MATHSSVLAWRLPGTEEPSGLPSMGSHRVRHDWSDLAAAVCVLEKAVAPHSSTLAWRIPWTEEPGRLQSMGSHRVGHDWATCSSSSSVCVLRHVRLFCHAMDCSPLVAQTVKSLPAIWETWIRFLSWEDPLEKEMATHSSNFAWKIPWMEEPGRYSPWGLKESDTNERLYFHGL